MKKIFAIGTGPGAADYLTLGAVKAIERSDVIFAPENNGKNLALDTASEFVKNKKVVMLDFPMVSVEQKHYENAVAVILKETPAQGTASFLTIGDPMIYSTFIYMMKYLEKENVDIEIISGVPSFVAAAGIAKIPLTKKGEVFVLTDKLNKNILSCADSIAHLKTSKDKKRILTEFENAEFDTVYIERASLSGQKILTDKAEIISSENNYISLMLARKGN